MPVPFADPLPRLRDDLTIQPFDAGTPTAELFLVRSAGRSFVINREMCCLITALVRQSNSAAVMAELHSHDGTAADADQINAAIQKLPPALLADATPGPPETPFHWQVQMMPANLVARISQRLYILLDPRLALALGVLLLLLLPIVWPDLVAARHHRLDPVGVVVVAAGVLLTALVHEFGHAAACRRFGAKPGAIGFALYLIFPVFYTDVNQAWTLRRRQRAVVDVGGMYFQLILVLAVLIPARWMGFRPADLAFLILLNGYLIVHNLNPMLKLDGYWLFSDLASLPNLHRRTWRLLGSGWCRRSAQRATGAEATTFSSSVSLALIVYTIALGLYLAFVLSTLPHWLAAQFGDYPERLGEMWFRLTATDAGSNPGAWAAALLELGGTLLLPVLVCSIPITWFSRLARRRC